jgi:hypothetical protein
MQTSCMTFANVVHNFRGRGLPPQALAALPRYVFGLLKSPLLRAQVLPGQQHNVQQPCTNRWTLTAAARGRRG